MPSSEKYLCGSILDFLGRTAFHPAMGVLSHGRAHTTRRLIDGFVLLHVQNAAGASNYREMTFDSRGLVPVTS